MGVFMFDTTKSRPQTNTATPTANQTKETNDKSTNRPIRDYLVNRRPTNRRSYDTPSHDRAAYPESMAKLMCNGMLPAGIAIEAIEESRQAGVRRGVNASIELIEAMLERHRKGSSGRAELELVIHKLRSLTMEQVEG
jgi:hypothetical protein